MAIGTNMVVGITYELRGKEDGKLIDSNTGGAPLEFITGLGHIIPGLERAIMAMEEGASGTVEVPAHEAYGTWDAALIESRPKAQFAGLDLFEGMTLYGQDEHGGVVQVVVKSFNDDVVEIDFNHPLAGKDLVFDLRIEKVREMTPEEAMTGQVQHDHSCSTGGCCGGCH